MRINLVSILLEDFAVIKLSTPSRYSGNSHEVSPSLAFQELVVATTERLAPDAIRASDTHAASILLIIGCLNNVIMF